MTAEKLIFRKLTFDCIQIRGLGLVSKFRYLFEKAKHRKHNTVLLIIQTFH